MDVAEADTMDFDNCGSLYHMVHPASLPTCVEMENVTTEADYQDLKPMQNHYEDDGIDGDTEVWQKRHPHSWNSEEVMAWVTHEAVSLPETVDLNQLRLEKFQTCNGESLRNMTKEEWVHLEPQYGELLHAEFQHLIMSSHYKAPDDADFAFSTAVTAEVSNLDLLQSESLLFGLDFDSLEPDLGIHHQRTPSSCEPESGYSTDGSIGDALSDSTASSSTLEASLTTLLSSAPDVPAAQQSPQPNVPLPPVASFFSSQEAADYGDLSIPSVVTNASTSSVALTSCKPPTKVPNKRGRPRKNPCDANGSPVRSHRGRKQATKGGHLWEFVRDLLLDPAYNPQIIRWESHPEGIFRFVKSDVVAKMWGVRKNNNTMTYEKLSRAMRFCRSSNFFSDVPKDRSFPKKLCFRFGPKATGWYCQGSDQEHGLLNCS